MTWRAISARPYPEDWLDTSKERKSTFQSVKLMHTGRLQFLSAEPTGTTQINLETFETGQDSGEQKVCYAESVAMPELFNGQWHHFAIVIEGYRRVAGRNGPFSAITFSIDGAAATKEISCKMEKPIRADRQYVAGLGAGKDMFDGLEKELDLKGTGLEPYYYRDTLVAMQAHAVVLIGGWAHRGPPLFYLFTLTRAVSASDTIPLAVTIMVATSKLRCFS